MKIEERDVSKNRKSKESVIRVNASKRGRISRTTLTERIYERNKKDKHKRR